MSNRNPDKAVATHEGFDGSFSGTHQRQILAGLQLDPTARLRWLERTLADLQRLRAGTVKPSR